MDLWKWFTGKRSTSAEESFQAWYKIFLKADDSRSKKSKGCPSEGSVVKAFSKHRLNIEPLGSHDQQRPVLVIYEAYDHNELEEINRKSHSLPSNELLVIITSSPVLEKTDRVVQLSWDRSKGKDQISDFGGSIAKIHTFVADGWKRQSSQEERVPTQGRPVQPGWRGFVGTSVDVSSHDKTAGDDQSEAAFDGGRGTAEIGEVYYAIDRDWADSLLEKAIAFVGEAGKIRMTGVREDFNRFTPLLVFCKNDTQLQEDIDNAMRKTRSGTDVMLVVVTDKKKVLVDTEATRAFGQKICLIWDHDKSKFRTKEHAESMLWIRDFLKPFHIKSSLKRTNSLNRSIRKRFLGEAFGFYHVPKPDEIPEEWIKKTISYFYTRLVTLEKSITRPLVLLTSDRADLEKYILKFLHRHNLGFRDVQVVVIFRGNCLSQLTNLTFLGLRMHDVNPEVLSSAQNETVAKTVKQFLVQNRPAQSSDGRGTTTSTIQSPDSSSAGFSVQHREDLIRGPAIDGDDHVFVGDTNWSRDSVNGLEREEAMQTSFLSYPEPDIGSTMSCSPLVSAQHHDHHDRLRGFQQNRPNVDHFESCILHQRRRGEDHVTRTGEEHGDQHLLRPGSGAAEHASSWERRSQHEYKPHLPQHPHPVNHPHQHHNRYHHLDNRSQKDRQDAAMDFEDAESGVGSDFSQQPAPKREGSRHSRSHNTCPKNFDYRSEAEKYEKTPNQPRSQRRRTDRPPRPTILPGGMYTQGGASLSTPAAVKRSADESLDDVVNAMDAVSLSVKERKQDLSPSNRPGAPRKEILRPKSKRRIQTFNPQKNTPTSRQAPPSLSYPPLHSTPFISSPLPPPL